MGRKCCVPGCRSNYDAAVKHGLNGISTFKFPDDESLRQGWTSAINRPKWKPSKNACVCIHHFAPEDIVKYEKPAQLRQNAVPKLLTQPQDSLLQFKRGRPTKKADDGPPREENIEIEILEEVLADADCIPSFDSMKQQIIAEKHSFGNWFLYPKDDTVYFFNLDADIDDLSVPPIRIRTCVKVSNNLAISVFLQSKPVTDGAQSLLGLNCTISRWSELKTILAMYDCDDCQITEPLFVDDEEETIVVEHLEDAEIDGNPLADLSTNGQNEEQTDDVHQLSASLAAIPTVDEEMNGKDEDDDHRGSNVQERQAVREKVRELQLAKHKCFICNQSHQSLEQFERHIPLHLDMLPYHCDRCHSKEVVLKTLASLNKHFLMHEKPLKCNKCDARFTYYSSRNLHEEQEHDNPGPFRCDVCFKELLTLRSFYNHSNTHKNPEATKCSICERSLSSPYELKMHLRIHTGEKPNKCPLCDASFNRLSNLREHKRSMHSKERPFRCETCGVQYRTNNELKRHREIHDPSLKAKRLASMAPLPKTTPSSKEHQCTTCHQTFSSSTKYYSHLRQHNKRYQCQKCGICYAQWGDFVDHENTHTGVRPYKCGTCDKQFKTSSTYYGHLAVHRNEKKHVCAVCGKAFKRFRHLVIHAQTHTNDAPYVCLICKHQFTDKLCYSRHLAKHVPPTVTADSAHLQDAEALASVTDAALLHETLAISDADMMDVVIDYFPPLSTDLATDESSDPIFATDIIDAQSITILGTLED